MTDRPILFSGPMVRALLDGRKTQTRRVIQPFEPAPLASAGRKPMPSDVVCARVPARLGGWTRGPAFRLRFAVGDRLWVRETWTARMTGGWTIADARSRMFQNELLYAADGNGSIDGWWPSIHMPREFSRLTLLVTDVRVERLQDISEADARAEGCPVTWDGKPYDPPPPEVDSWQGYGRYSYCLLWNSLNAARGFGWDANPWVVALTFTVHHQNIDALGAKEEA